MTTAIAEAEAPAETPLRHLQVGPLKVFDGGPEDAVNFCLDAIARGTGARVATANVDFLALALDDEQLRADLEACDLVVADGAPVARLARLMGARSVRRVAGVDLVLALCRAGTRERPLRIALYGSDPATARAARAWINEDERAQVVAVINPPFRDLTAEEQAEERRRIAEARPDVIFVALGCPKQERRIADYYSAAPSAVWIGVGGTFDFIAGKRTRAPRAMQAAGLEWVARLAQEPRRLWRRYLLRDIPALFSVARWCLAARMQAPRGRSRV